MPQPPTVSCRAWLVADAETGDILAAHNASQRLQPASLTKILTALVVLRRTDKDPDFLQTRVRVSHFAASVKAGTHARLQQGHSYTIEHLLYALMLPSGNDAAVALAQHLGSGTQCIAC